MLLNDAHELLRENISGVSMMLSSPNVTDLDGSCGRTRCIKLGGFLGTGGFFARRDVRGIGCGRVCGGGADGGGS